MEKYVMKVIHITLLTDWTAFKNFDAILFVKTLEKSIKVDQHLHLIFNAVLNTQRQSAHQTTIKDCFI